MKEDKFFFDYENQPGKAKREKTTIIRNTKPLVSIITAYYNGNVFLQQTINCVLNQTFEDWEWIIVDDGSDNQEAIEFIDSIANIDERIKVFHKKNEGLAKTRDYAIKHAKAEYILPLDDDDLIEENYIEILYWALKTNIDATWAFTNSVGFGKWLYLSDYRFDSERMKTDNHITATALIKKDKIIELGGYGVAKRYVNEDWHLWLRMLQKGCYPVQVNEYGFWYRRREKSLLTHINDKKNKENELRIRDLKTEADKITQQVYAKIYPINNENENLIESKLPSTIDYYNNKSQKEIYILKRLGANKKFLKLIKEKSKNNKVVILILDQTTKSNYVYRQKLQQHSIVYDLPSFLDKKYYNCFISYVLLNNNIRNIYIDDEINKDNIDFFKKHYDSFNPMLFKYDKCDLRYKLIILSYKAKNTILGRGIRKIIRIIGKEIN